MHIILAMVKVLIMFLVIGFGAMGLGRRFRIYSFSSMLILIVFGVLTGIDGPKIAENLPTPWIGVWERINILSFLIWIVVLAFDLLRQEAE